MPCNTSASMPQHCHGGCCAGSMLGKVWEAYAHLQGSAHILQRCAVSTRKGCLIAGHACG